MFIVRALLPLLYCLLVGTAYGVAFKRKFIDSIAPAFFLQIIIMLLTGVIFEKLTIGIVLGVFLAVAVLIYYSVKESAFSRVLDVVADSEKHIELDVWLFVFVYVFIFISNVGKHFYMWDEFSHWGWFVREMFQDNALFCTSSEQFAHIDYVPGVSLFEVLWCKMSLRYSEPNAYRGIQMLQASMMMPLAASVSQSISEKNKTKGHRILVLIFHTFIVFAIPLFSKLLFYHTLYKDLILGVFVFYCLWITLYEKFGGYSVFVFGLSLSNLIICKMTALAFIPILFLFFAVFHHKYADKSVARVKIWVLSAVAAIVSIIPWRIYNSYSARYVSSDSSGQNYSSIGLSRIIDVITHNGNISYQDDVEYAYIDAIRSIGIIGELSYIWIIVGCVVMLLLLMLVVNRTTDRSKIRLISLWIFLAGVYYVILMYFMYLTMFSEYEATSLASYDRYMSTYVLVALLLTAAAYILYASESFSFVSYFTVILLAENIVLFFGADQLLPGLITHEQIVFEGHSDYLSKSLPKGAKLLFICATEDIDAVVKIHFYCEGTIFGTGIYGEPIRDDDVESRKVSIDEFVDECTVYDYIYFFSYNDDFIELYQDAFEEENVIAPGKLYKVEKVNGKIRTIDVD